MCPPLRFFDYMLLIGSLITNTNVFTFGTVVVLFLAHRRYKISRGHSAWALNARGLGKICEFRPKLPFFLLLRETRGIILDISYCSIYFECWLFCYDKRPGCKWDWWTLIRDLRIVCWYKYVVNCTSIIVVFNKLISHQFLICHVLSILRSTAKALLGSLINEEWRVYS